MFCDIIIFLLYASYCCVVLTILHVIHLQLSQIFADGKGNVYHLIDSRCQKWLLPSKILNIDFMLEFDRLKNPHRSTKY